MTGDKTGAGGWDAAITAIVLGAVIALVVYLVESYGKDMEKISTILGVVVPVLRRRSARSSATTAAA